jgi:hypothetical protein
MTVKTSPKSVVVVVAGVVRKTILVVRTYSRVNKAKRARLRLKPQKLLQRVMRTEMQRLRQRKTRQTQTLKQARSQSVSDVRAVAQSQRSKRWMRSLRRAKQMS